MQILCVFVQIKSAISLADKIVLKLFNINLFITYFVFLKKKNMKLIKFLNIIYFYLKSKTNFITINL